MITAEILPEAAAWRGVFVGCLRESATRLRNGDIDRIGILVVADLLDQAAAKFEGMSMMQTVIALMLTWRDR